MVFGSTCGPRTVSLSLTLCDFCACLTSILKTHCLTHACIFNSPGIAPTRVFILTCICSFCRNVMSTEAPIESCVYWDLLQCLQEPKDADVRRRSDRPAQQQTLEGGAGNRRSEGCVLYQASLSFNKHRHRNERWDLPHWSEASYCFANFYVLINTQRQCELRPNESGEVGKSQRKSGIV